MLHTTQLYGKMLMIHLRNVRNGNTGIQTSSTHLSLGTDVHITKEAIRVKVMAMETVMEPVMEATMMRTNPYQDSKHGSSSLLCCLLFHSDENSTFD